MTASALRCSRAATAWKGLDHVCQGQHDEVLREGQADLIEQRPIGSHHNVHHGFEREAGSVLQAQSGLIRIHCDNVMQL
ncbi:hypothetical protein [Methylobacterium planeticum]|uniref:Uncharacterized protein n=1 Tax=Methylobacterium planeticum TaxID=2615211 RepID=A0A6N6MTQ5_9HYPH|nr:hypothetical protein [Methylobacterium planeticum]KAB1072974.1 hypothetical protein F6X51_13400 [Methylobacterium planeticum]